jgi:hypothetical protein
MNGGRYEVTEKQLSESNVSSRLVIRKASLAEMGKYECVAKNSLGVAETVVRVYSKHLTATLSAKWFTCNVQ